MGDHVTVAAQRDGVLGLLEGNTINRDRCSGGNERASVHRALDSAGWNEQYVQIPDGDIASLATQQSFQIDPLLLKAILSPMKQPCLSGRGDMGRATGYSNDLQHRHPARGVQY